MAKIKALIVDDSVVYRTQIRAALQSIGPIEIVGAASNGRLALDRMRQAPADLVILDLEMPEMDGLQMLREMAQAGFKAKVLVFSSISKRGAEATLEALRLGASDFIPKPGGEIASGQDQASLDPSLRIRAALEPRIRALFPEEFSMSRGVEPSGEPAAPSALSRSAPVGGSIKIEMSSVAWSLFKPKILVIGSSTGGPTVLERIFSGVTGPLACPIVIAQHMPPIFTAQLAERLGRLSGIKTVEARHDMRLQSNHVYVAPGDYHCRLVSDADGVKFSLDKGPLIHSVRPAVDPLFESAADLFAESTLAFVLTGMGVDGKAGAEKVKMRHGSVVIQSEETCVVFGMPGAVFAAGAYNKIASPQQIVEIIREKLSGSATAKTA